MAYKPVAYLDITYGEYRARCGCCTTFRTHPPGVGLRARYDNKVRRAVLDRILDDGMSVERALASMRREFLLDLSDGFVYDCLRDHAATLDMADHRRWVLERFSGTLCVDELHLGRFTLLLATDPLQRPAGGLRPGRQERADHMRRFLKNLKACGLAPQVVVTDGSNLYPALLAELWPEARPPAVRLPCPQGDQRQGPRRRAAAAAADGRRGNRGRKRKRGRPPRTRPEAEGPDEQGEGASSSSSIAT